MSMRREIGRAAAVVTLLVGAAAPSQAQRGRGDATRELFTWAGSVDREVLLVMRGRDLDTRGTNDEPRARMRERVRDALPTTDGTVRVRVEQGRGDVEVVQQPNARNDYTAVVRIRDRQSGADRYRVSATWEGYGYADGRGNGGWWGRGRDRDDDDRNDRDDRRGRGGYGNGGYGNGGYGNGGYGNGGYARPGALQWSGEVDDVVEIRVQGNRVDYVTRSGNGVRAVRTQWRGDALPSQEVRVALQLRDGRGSAYLVEQPTARNGYTAVVRINDARSGFGYYDFDLRW